MNDSQYTCSYTKCTVSSCLKEKKKTITKLSQKNKKQKRHASACKCNCLSQKTQPFVFFLLTTFFSSFPWLTSACEGHHLPHTQNHKPTNHTIFWFFCHFHSPNWPLWCEEIISFCFLLITNTTNRTTTTRTKSLFLKIHRSILKLAAKDYEEPELLTEIPGIPKAYVVGSSVLVVVFMCGWLFTLWQQQAAALYQHVVHCEERGDANMGHTQKKKPTSSLYKPNPNQTTNQHGSNSILSTSISTCTQSFRTTTSAACLFWNWRALATRPTTTHLSWSSFLGITVTIVSYQNHLNTSWHWIFCCGFSFSSRLRIDEWTIKNSFSFSFENYVYHSSCLKQGLFSRLAGNCKLWTKNHSQWKLRLITNSKKQKNTKHKQHDSKKECLVRQVTSTQFFLGSRVVSSVSFFFQLPLFGDLQQTHTTVFTQSRLFLCVLLFLNEIEKNTEWFQTHTPWQFELVMGVEWFCVVSRRRPTELKRLAIFGLIKDNKLSKVKMDSSMLSHKRLSFLRVVIFLSKTLVDLQFSGNNLWGYFCAKTNARKMRSFLGSLIIGWFLSFFRFCFVGSHFLGAEISSHFVWRAKKKTNSNIIQKNPKKRQKRVCFLVFRIDCKKKTVSFVLI